MEIKDKLIKLGENIKESSGIDYDAKKAFSNVPKETIAKMVKEQNPEISPNEETRIMSKGELEEIKKKTNKNSIINKDNELHDVTNNNDATLRNKQRNDYYTDLINKISEASKVNNDTVYDAETCKEYLHYSKDAKLFLPPLTRYFVQEALKGVEVVTINIKFDHRYGTIEYDKENHKLTLNYNHIKLVVTNLSLLGYKVDGFKVNTDNDTMTMNVHCL